MKGNWKWILLAITLTVALGCDNEEPAAEADWIIAVTANPATIGTVNPTECDDPSDPSRCGYYGSSQLRAIVYNGNGTPQKGVGLRFATDQGRLDSGGEIVKTNSRGEAEDVLWTHDDATVTVTSGSVEATVDVSVGNENEAPIAIADIIPANEARIGRLVMFDAGESTDDVEIVKYVWNIQSDNPDPDKANPLIREDEPPNDHFQETFDLPQTLRVMLTVYDGDDVSSRLPEPIFYEIVDNMAPTAEAGAPLTQAPEPAEPDYTCIVRICGSGTDPDGTIKAYQFNWGNEVDPPLSVACQTQTYRAANTYTVTLTVYDDGNQQGSCNSAPPQQGGDTCASRRTGTDTTQVTCLPRE